MQEASQQAARNKEARSKQRGGQQQLDSKLAAAGLSVSSSSVQQVPNAHAYQASVTVRFTPFFGGLSIPTVSGPISIIPNAFDISYSAVEDVSVY